LAQFEAANPELAEASARADAADLARRVASAAWHPRVDLVGAYLAFGSTDSDLQGEWQTGVRLGFFSTLAFASSGWIGIRAMTWFFFARYGTPALLAVVARQTLGVEVAPEEERPHAPEPDWWRGPINALKAEHEWFRSGARELLELLSLPVLQMLACAINCATTVITARAAFKLPFTRLEEVMMQDTLAQVLRGRKPMSQPD